MSTHAKSFKLMSPGLMLLGIGGTIGNQASAQIEFEISQTLPTATRVSGVLVADMNRDALRDLVVCESLESISLYEHLNNGEFVRRGSLYDAQGTLSDLQGADLDLDGDTDVLWIVTKRRQSGPPYFDYSLRVFVNGGSGRSGQLQMIDLGTRMPGGFAVGDLDGDRIPEIIVVDGYARDTSTNVRVFGRQSGIYVLEQTIALAYNDARDVVLGDVDLDGDLDVCALDLNTYDDSYYGFKIYDSQIEVLSNDGAGQLVEGPHINLAFGSDNHDPLPLVLRMGDLDGDGDLDFALAAAPFYNSDPMAVQMIESQDYGTTFVQHPQVLLGTSVYKQATLSMADLDTDGDLDLLTIYNGNNAWLFENQGGFAFDVTPADVQGFGNAPPVFVDLDSDGDVDLVESVGNGTRLVSNVTPYDGPVLAHTPLKRGTHATLTVTEAQPGDAVYFLYSLAGEGNSRGLQRFGGITMDLSGTIYEAGNAVADANGAAQIGITVPNGAPLQNVILQAAIRRGVGGADSVKTPFRTARISQ